MSTTRLDLKRNVMPVVRVVLTVAMLALLLRRVHLSSLLPGWRTNAMGYLIASLAVTLGGIVLSAMRWQRVLTALDLRAKLSTLVNHYLASLFVGNFLPSTIGGDVLRVTRLSSTNKDAPATFASVVLERMSGWLVLPVISLAGLTMNPELMRLGASSKVALSFAIGTLVLLVTVLVATGSRTIGGRLAHFEGWLRFAGAVHLGIDRFRRKPMAALEVLGAGFAYQLAVMVAAFFAAQALGLHVGWTAILAFMPAVAIAQVVPVPTVGGLGVREGALVLFLRPLGVGTSQAIAFGLLLYGINLTVSLIGAPSFAVGSSSGTAAPTQPA